MERTDETLWNDHIAGDQAAFASLVQRYARELFSFVVRFVNDADLADDLVQETFLQAHLARESFDPTRRFRPWLFTIAANKARDRLRQRQRRPESLASGDVDPREGNGTSLLELLGQFDTMPEQSIESNEQAQQVRNIITDMPDALRETLLLAYFQQFAYRDIAAMLGVPVGTIKSRVHSAVKWFAREFQQRHGEPSSNHPNLSPTAAEES